MKQFLIFTLSLIILCSCTSKTNWKSVVAVQQLADGDDQSMLIDASLASSKKQKKHRKHSSCQHYHKKKYE